MTAYQAHVKKWGQCTACPLWQTRKHVVLARGTVPCDILFCGESPGDSEDVTAQPFQGPAGKLLDRIVARAIPASLGLRLAYTNLTACIPVKVKGDHEPTRESMDKCRPRLEDFVGLVASPRLIVAVGRLAKRELYAARDSGNDEWLKNRKFCDILHPSHILQAPDVEKSMMIKTAVVVLESAVVNLIRGSRRL